MLLPKVKIKNILQFAGLMGLLLVIIVYFFNKTSNNNENNVSENEILELKITIKDHKFNPNIIKAPSGKKIRLIVHNQDSTVEEFESIDLHREKIVMPNNSISMIIAPLAPGKYDFFGDFHQDTAQGSLIIE